MGEALLALAEDPTHAKEMASTAASLALNVLEQFSGIPRIVNRYAVLVGQLWNACEKAPLSDQDCCNLVRAISGV